MEEHRAEASKIEHLLLDRDTEIEDDVTYTTPVDKLLPGYGNPTGGASVGVTSVKLGL